MLRQTDPVSADRDLISPAAWHHLLGPALLLFLFATTVALPATAQPSPPATASSADAPASAAAGDTTLPGLERAIEPEMVLIPGGEFLMGRDDYSDHSPVHEVRLDPFYLDKYEVTNDQYIEFCQATGRRLPEFWGMDVYRSGPAYPNHPVLGISWSDAVAYARWREVRLPTEAEWEYAARGGLIGKKYSHGDELDPNLYAETGITGTAGPSRVGSYPANGYGLHDMTGNVLEWVRDWFDPDYYAESPEENPPGPGQGRFKVCRGGGWHTGPGCARVDVRTALQSNWLDFNVGFRCARYAGESAARRLQSLIAEEGLAAALTEVRVMRAAPPGSFYFSEGELNSLGYQLLGAEQTTAAIAVFEVGIALFPDSYNAHDSLGEAYLTAGQMPEAIRAYERSLELNPANDGGREKLRELGGEER